MIRLTALILLVLVIVTATLEADTIYLKNENTLEGIIKREDEDYVLLDIGFGTVGVRKDDIKRIYKSSENESWAIRQKWERQKREMEERERKDRLEKDLQPKEVDISSTLGHTFADVVLNRRVKASLLLDTGASLVVLTSDIGKKLGIDLEDKKDNIQLITTDGSKVNAKYAILDSISVQGVEAENVEAAILLGEVKEADFKDGLLGMSFLKRFNFKIDHRDKKLILEKLQ